MANDVVVCTWSNDREATHALAPELFTAARRAADALHVDVRWALIGDCHDAAAVAGQYGARAVDRFASERLRRFEPDVYVEALARYVEQCAPRLLLLPQTFDARLLAPRLAARTQAGVVMNGFEVRVEEGDAVSVAASAYGGDTRAVYEIVEGPVIIGLVAGAVEPATAAMPASVEERDVPLALENTAERIRVVEPARAEGPRLEDADVIIAGGRGLGSASNFRLIEELAEALGGMAAASRPIVDDGWVDPARQVGLTGKVVRPALYVAIGVSGASQHMAGCSAAKTIVAINSDRDAAIFRHARYGIVGDCLEIVPELIRAAREK